MRSLTCDHLAQLKCKLAPDGLQEHISKVLGGCCAANGLWRFFSDVYPEPGGILAWNAPDGWRNAWSGLGADLHFFGEDIFGNQLALQPNKLAVGLWNHENSDMIDLLLDPASLLETVHQHGLNWIDYYAQNILEVANRRLADVPPNCHLHWTQPLILNGSVNLANTSVVERTMHLRGHAQLWAQLQQLPPGAGIQIKRNDSKRNR